jgi:hypothetical protein
MAERLTKRQRRRFNNIREEQGKGAARKFRRKKLGLTPRSKRPGNKGKLGPNTNAPNLPRRPTAKGKKLTRPAGIINTQQQFNEWNAQQQHMLNRPNERNPYGELKYTVDPETGQLIRETNLSAPQQEMLEQRQNIDKGLGQGVQNMMGQMGQSFNFNNPYNPQAMSGWEGRQKLTDEQFGRQKTLLDDRFKQERDQLTQSLADRGIPEGSELYNQELMQFDRRKNDAYDQAYTTASQFGGQEQVNQFNMGMTGQQNAFNNQYQTWQSPYQAAGSMLGMQQGIINPQFQNMAQVNMPNTDVTGVGTAFGGFQNNIDTANIAANASMHNAGLAAQNRGGSSGFSPTPLAPPPAQQQGSPSPWPGVVGAIGSGLATGIGAGLLGS